MSILAKQKMADEEEIDILGEEEDEDETEKKRPRRKKKDEDEEEYDEEEEVDLLDIDRAGRGITKVDLVIYIVLLIAGLVIGWLLSMLFSKVDNIEKKVDGGTNHHYYMDNPENRKYFFGDKPMHPVPIEKKEREEATIIGLTTHSPKLEMYRDESGEIEIRDDSQYDVEKWVIKRNKRTGKIIDLMRSLS